MKRCPTRLSGGVRCSPISADIPLHMVSRVRHVRDATATSGPFGGTAVLPEPVRRLAQRRRRPRRAGRRRRQGGLLRPARAARRRLPPALRPPRGERADPLLEVCRVRDATATSPKPRSGRNRLGQASHALRGLREDVRRRGPRARVREGREPPAATGDHAPPDHRGRGASEGRRRDVAATGQAPAVPAPRDVPLPPQTNRPSDIPRRQTRVEALQGIPGRGVPAADPAAFRHAAPPHRQARPQGPRPRTFGAASWQSQRRRRPCRHLQPVLPKALRAFRAPQGAGPWRRSAIAYHRATGRPDLGPKALIGVATGRPLSPAYFARRGSRGFKPPWPRVRCGTPGAIFSRAGSGRNGADGARARASAPRGRRIGTSGDWVGYRGSAGQPSRTSA